MEPLFSFDISKDEPIPPRDGLAPGSVIAGWRVVRRIAGGAVSAVYEAIRDGTDAGVPDRAAIKVFDERRMDESAMRRFRLHATVLGGLTHPGLVGVREWGVEQTGRPFLIMPLVEGSTFDAWLASDGASDAQAIIEVLAQAAEAVGRAHLDMGIVHRDLKPSNLMVETPADGSPRARVIDFGVAMVLQGAEPPSDSLRTHGGAVVGTPAYMAPEQLYAGSRPVDARADVYALGVMVHEALTGSRPVRTTELSLVEAAREKERVRVSASRIRRLARAEGLDVSSATAAVVATALSPDPEDRHPDGVALALDLRRTMRGAPAQHRGPGPVRRFRRFLGRERRLASALLALFATLTLSAGVIAALAIRAERARREERAQTERLIAMVRSWTHGAFLQSFQAPGSEPALIAVTEAVIHALEEACAVRPDDIELADHLSFAYAQLASVVGAPGARSLGNEVRARELHDKSIAAMERSITLYRAQRPGDEPRARLSLVRAIKRRASVTDDDAERRALLDRAMSMSSEALARLPDDEDAIISHAGTMTTWASEHEKGERHAAIFEQAIGMLERVPSDSPRFPSVRSQRLVIHLEAAADYAETDAARSRAHLATATKLLDETVGEKALDPRTPRDGMLLRLLARVEMIQAQIAKGERAWEVADERSAACVARTRAVFEAEPTNPVGMLDLATRLRQRAEILLAIPARATDEASDRNSQRAEAGRLGAEGLALIRGFMPERPRTRLEAAEIAALQRVLNMATE